MTGPIFTSHRPGSSALPLSPSGIWLLVTRIAKRAGMDAIRPHDLRRTFASLAQNGGADLTTIRHALGHSSVATTERYLSQIADLRKGHAAGDHIRIKTKAKAETKAKEAA